MMQTAVSEAEEISQTILDLIFDMRSVVSDPRHTKLGLQREINHYHACRIQMFVRQGRPVRMILPAFPAKSPNRNKTFGPSPDLGEVLALTRLQKLCDEIKEVYEPGAEVIICSDGRVFSDIVQVPDDEVTAYTKAIATIVKAHGLQSLRIFNLEDAYDDLTSFGLMRERLFSDFAESIDSIRANILKDPNERSLFDGIHRFLFEDLVVLQPELSRSQARERSKQATYQLLRRSHAWSRFVEERFAGAVRLSIHPQTAVSPKIGIRLLPSNQIWRTPWHSVVIYDGQQYQLTTRAEAEENGAIRIRNRDGYEFFVSVPQEAKGVERVAFA